MVLDETINMFGIISEQVTAEVTAIRTMQENMSGMLERKEDIVCAMERISDIAEKIVQSVNALTETTNKKKYQVDFLAKNADTLNREAEELSHSMRKFKV